MKIRRITKEVRGPPDGDGTSASPRMTPSNGSQHQEMPRPAPRMPGLQLWLNLSQAGNMAEPKYFDIAGDRIGIIETDEAVVRIVSGESARTHGVKPQHIQEGTFDVTVKPGKSILLPTQPEANVTINLIQGDALIEGRRIAGNTAVHFGEGDAISITAPTDAETRFIYLSGNPLHKHK